MLTWLRNKFSNELAIDLGTSSVRIGLPGDGIRIDEPSVVAVTSGRAVVPGKGAAVGHLARQMLGRTPDGIKAVRPITHGVISDFELTEATQRRSRFESHFS